MQLSHWKSYCEWIRLKITGLLADGRESFFGILHLHQLQMRKQKSDTVLIVEFHAWHGETLPGYVRYFQDLGYRVAVAGRLPLLKEAPFCRMTEKPECFCMTFRQIGRFLQSDGIAEYAFCLVASDPVWSGQWKWLIQRIGKFPMGKRGGSAIIHDWDDFLTNAFPNSLQQVSDHAFALTPMIFHGVKIAMLNPHFFGENCRKNPEKQDTAVFVIVGSIQKSKRNFDELISAFNQLHGKWHLKIVGNVDEPDCLQHCRKQVEILGRLNFPDMYRVLEQSDFLLPLLDPERAEHLHYLHSCTSGSRQLCLGFSVIPVIHRAFGEHYGFTDDNAVLYEKGGLAEAMQRAIDMKNEEYQSLVHGLQQEQQRVYAESLGNLKRRLNRS